MKIMAIRTYEFFLYDKKVVIDFWAFVGILIFLVPFIILSVRFI